MRIEKYQRLKELEQKKMFKGQRYPNSIKETTMDSDLKSGKNTPKRFQE